MAECDRGLRRQLRIWAVAALATLSAGGPPATGAMRATQPLTVASLGSRAQGEARVVVRRVHSGLDGTLVVVVRHLDAETTRDGRTGPE